MRIVVLVALLLGTASGKIVCPHGVTCPTGTTTTGVPCTTCPTTTVTTTTTTTTTTTLPPVQGAFFIDNSCTNNGDGKANSCAASPGGVGAWNALNNLNCAAISPPDSTLTIRSHGGTARSQRYVERWTALENSSCSGSAGHPFVIQNASGEDVVMDGTVNIQGNTWTDRGGGIWECTSGANCGPPSASDVFFAAWYAKASISGGAEQRLKLVNQIASTCAGAALNTNEMALLTGASGHVCARLADGSSPATADYFDVPRQTLWLSAFNQPNSYITLQKNPGGGSWTVHRFRNHIISLDAASNIGWVIDGLTVGWNYDRGIQMTGVTGMGQPNLVVQNCIVEYCGQEGIRADSVAGGTTRFENNEIRFTQHVSVFANCGNRCRKSYDNGTPVRLALAQGVTVRGNYIHDTGGGNGGTGRSRAIDFEGFGTGHLVENNYIVDQQGVEDGGDSQQATGAINLSSAQGLTPDWSGNVIRNNRMENVENCFRINPTSDTPTMTPTVFENNTCVNAKFTGIEAYGGGLMASSPPFAWTNNIFANFGSGPLQPMVKAPGPLGSAFDITTFTYNDFFCAACAAGTSLITYNGSTAVATNGSVTALDPNSTYAVPALSLSGTPPSLKIINTGGAYGLGFAISPAFPDFEGDTRPQSQGWDIGADEFTGTTGTTSSTVTSTSTVTTTSGAATTTTSTSTSTSTTTIPTPVQVLSAGGFVAPSTGVPTRAGIAGSQWSTDSNIKSEQVIPTSGIVGGLRVLAQTDPGGSASWTIVLMKNEAATGLTCTVSSGTTACHDTTTAHNVTFGIGDRASIQLTPASTPASGAIQVSTLWQPTVADETIWPGSLGTDTTGTGNFLPLNTRTLGNTTRAAVVPIPGTIKHLAAWTNTNVVTGATRTFTLRKNGVDTVLSCTVPEGANACTDSDGADAITVVAGDLVQTNETFTGVPLGQPGADGFVFVPSTTTEFVAGMSFATTTPTTATDQFTPLNGSLIGTSLTTENLLAQSVGQAMTLKNIYVKLAGNTGASSVLAVTLRKNAADTALTCSMTNAATCNLTTDVTAVNDDKLGTLWHHTGSAGTSQESAVSYSAIFTGTFP